MVLNLRVVILVINTTTLRPISGLMAPLISTAHSSTKLLSLDLRDLSISLVLGLLDLLALLRDLVLTLLISLNQVHRDRLDPLLDPPGPIREPSALLAPIREILAPLVPLRDPPELPVLVKDHSAVLDPIRDRLVLLLQAKIHSGHPPNLDLPCLIRVTNTTAQDPRVLALLRLTPLLDLVPKVVLMVREALVPKTVLPAKDSPVLAQEPKLVPREVFKEHKDLKALPSEVLASHPASAKKKDINTKPKLLLVLFKTALQNTKKET